MSVRATPCALRPQHERRTRHLLSHSLVRLLSASPSTIPPSSRVTKTEKNVCVQESNTGAMLFVSPRALPGPLLGSCNPKGSGWSSTIHMCVDCRPTRRLPVAKVSRWIDRGRASRGGHGPETTIFSKETARAKQSRVVASSTRPVATTFLFYNTRRRFLTTGGTHTVC